MCFFYRRFCPSTYAGTPHGTKTTLLHPIRQPRDVGSTKRTGGRHPCASRVSSSLADGIAGFLICFPDENKSIPARRDRYIIPRLRGLSFGVSRISRREAIYHFTIRRAAVGCGRPPRAVNVVQKTAALLCKMREKTRRGKSSVEKSRDM